jgi:hypothetical protein
MWAALGSQLGTVKNTLRIECMRIGGDANAHYDGCKVMRQMLTKNLCLNRKKKKSRESLYEEKRIPLIAKMNSEEIEIADVVRT